MEKLSSIRTLFFLCYVWMYENWPKDKHRNQMRSACAPRSFTRRARKSCTRTFPTYFMYHHSIQSIVLHSVSYRTESNYFERQLGIPMDQEEQQKTVSNVLCVGLTNDSWSHFQTQPFRANRNEFDIHFVIFDHSNAYKFWHCWFRLAFNWYQ